MTEWFNWNDGEPPIGVNRVRWEDGAEAIRGATCEYEGAPHSHWAYTIAYKGQVRTPSEDSTRQDEGGWHCWLDLDFVGRWTPVANEDEQVKVSYCPPGAAEMSLPDIVEFVNPITRTVVRLGVPVPCKQFLDLWPTLVAWLKDGWLTLHADPTSLVLPGGVVKDEQASEPHAEEGQRS